MLVIIILLRKLGETSFDRMSSHAVTWTVQFPFYVYSELIFLDLDFREAKFWGEPAHPLPFIHTLSVSLLVKPPASPLAAPQLLIHPLPAPPLRPPDNLELCNDVHPMYGTQYS